MSANELRRAAETLRLRAEACTPAPWFAVGRLCVVSGNGGRNSVAEGLGVAQEANADHIATMHPGVSLALADWLEAIAISWVWDEHPDDVETPDGWPLTLEESIDTIPLKIARLINGGAA